MNLWIGDYLKLRNDIYYLEFKLTDPELPKKEIVDVRKKLDERLYREGQFKVILKSFDDLENQILIMRYAEGLTLNKVAENLGYTVQYIYNKHAKILETISTFERLHTELKQFEKNFPLQRKK
ncbi:sigma factor-like helix-turn-helix DNA-binding protein [Sporosarcina sp. P17b]|uniref:sigma factor-like helix-turn-helix DNA-binding protein n=1 Tax=Sporosarcina sp. P17b TaxID=2048260 RepID=UPI000C169140|nr:sigma factor-like helix-turn-helix DNA-binding protein [Sporosarcina sp. P17b]PIC75039.1 hypothetical protein CSV76_00055 [Sporosarcina sp. P17b]